MVRPYHWGGVPPHWQNLELEHIYTHIYDLYDTIYIHLTQRNHSRANTPKPVFLSSTRARLGFRANPKGMNWHLYDMEHSSEAWTPHSIMP